MSNTGNFQTDSHLDRVFSRDLNAAHAKFQSWLVSRLNDKSDVKVTRFEHPKIAGLSHELISADISWREGGAQHINGIMIRVDPVRYRKRFTSNLRREFEVISILGRRGDVPVPEAYWYEADTGILDAAFFVMKRLDGNVIGDPPFRQEGWLFGLPPHGRRTVWNNAICTLAKIHLVPAGELSVLRREDSTTSDLDQHLKYWRASYEWATAAKANPLAEAGWDWLMRNKPASYPRGLSWGDAHPRNLMFRDLDCTAVFDWEDVSLSSPLYDLARWFLADHLMAVSTGTSRLAGIPARHEVVELWESRTGYVADELRWFEVFVCCCGAGTLARTAQLQREIFGKSVSVDGRMLAPLMARLERLLAGAEVE